jgi:hypothetical protein
MSCRLHSVRPNMMGSARRSSSEVGLRFVEGHPEILCRLERRAGRRADRQPRIGRSGMGHRHVESARSADRERALLARSAVARRRHQLLFDVRRVGRAARRAAASRRRASCEHDGTCNSGGGATAGGGRRSRAVGQPLHDASPRRVRSNGASRDAPHADPRSILAAQPQTCRIPGAIR